MVSDILAFDNRPFKTIDEMDKTLVDNWNKVIKPGDICYVVGDMFWCGKDEAIKVLDQLNGVKFLIKGNHDRCNDGRFIKKFAKVTEYMEIDDNGRKVTLCHYPIPYFKNHYYGWYHLYGHVHTTWEYDMVKTEQDRMIKEHNCQCNMYNVGAMLIGYTPRILDEIIQGVE